MHKVKIFREYPYDLEKAMNEWFEKVGDIEILYPPSIYEGQGVNVTATIYYKEKNETKR